MSVLSLGAPGVFFDTPATQRALIGVRRDVAAFAGVTPRGPARRLVPQLEPDVDVVTYLSSAAVQRSVPVAVESWDEYRRIFGGFEGNGRLPYAVSAFFAQGGRRAYVVRIVHDYDDDAANAAGKARGVLAFAGAPGAPANLLQTTGGAVVTLTARDEGVWGDRLRATLTWSTRPVALHETTPEHAVVPTTEWIPVGSLLRLTLPGGVTELRYVDDSKVTVLTDRPEKRRIIVFATNATEAPTTIEVVTGNLIVTDHDPSCRRSEQLTGLGMRADHPRWIARALIEESELLLPEVAWAAGTCDIGDSALPPLRLTSEDGVDDHLRGGSDRSAEIVPDDFFDRTWIPGDERAADGIQCLAEIDEVGMLVTPDLYAPSPLAPVDDIEDPPTLAGPTFEPCIEPVEITPLPPEAPELAGLRLDPSIPADLATITALQVELAQFAEARRDVTVLLDVPPGLSRHRMLAWRGTFDSRNVAAYHPWLDVALPDDARDALVSVNPSAFAAGVIAARENSHGVHFGAANVIAQGAVRASDAVDRTLHDALHVEGINVIMTERDGLRLTAARTLSRDPQWRQLNVVRLITVIKLTLEREMGWLVFEPSNQTTWTAVRRVITDYLDGLHRRGAFAGATSKQSFFVRCGTDTMTRNDIDNGRLIAEIGVAPAEPVEYIVIRLDLTSDAPANAASGSTGTPAAMTAMTGVTRGGVA